MEEILKGKSMWIVGALVALIILYVLFRKPVASASGNSNAGGTLYYGTGLNPQQALELAGMEIQAQSANLNVLQSAKVNLANIAALRDVNNNSINQSAAVEQAQIAANQTVALNTNQTNLALANANIAGAEEINLQNVNTAENLSANAAPSPFMNFAGALSQLLQTSSFRNQIGSFNFGGLFSAGEGGGGGGGGFNPFSLFGGGGGGGTGGTSPLSMLAI